MTLKGKRKSRLKNWMNWDETLINSFRILVGTLFRPIAFEGYRDLIIFLI